MFREEWWKYITSVIGKTSTGDLKRGLYLPATADNKPEEDARHLCMLSSLHCVRLQSRRFATFVAGDRNDFFRRDVSCNCHQETQELEYDL